MWTIMLSAHGLTLIARAILLSFSVVFAVGVFAPGLLPEGISWAFEVQWRAPCFFLLALLAHASFPGLRRKHLTALAVVVACGLELMVGLVGREPSVAKVIAGAAGVGAAWLPGLVDRLRTRYRDRPYAAIFRSKALDQESRAI